MKEIILSCDELTECTEKYNQASECISSAIIKIKRLMQCCEKESDTYEKLSVIVSTLYQQTEALERLSGNLLKVRERYEKTEQEALMEVKRMVFSPDDSGKIDSIIVENNMERSESMLMGNSLLAHENWFGEIIMKDIYRSMR